MKFVSLLVWRVVIFPIGSVLLLPILLIAWAILGIIVFLMQTWKDAYER